MVSGLPKIAKRTFGFVVVGVAAISSLAIEDGSAAEAGGADTTSISLRTQLETASPGDTIRVPAGVYPGPLHIDKSVTLIGEPGAILQGPGRGDVVKISAPGVTLRGFTIQGTGKSLDQENAGITVLADETTLEDNLLRDVLFGIYLKDAADCVIRGNEIHGKDLDLASRGDAIRIWYSHRCRIEKNRVLAGRDVVIWFSEGVVIRGNRVMDGRYGLHFMYSDNNVIEGNHLEGNSVGGFLMYSRNLTLRGNVFAHNRGPSGYGIGLKDMDGVLVEDNRFSGNRIGVYIDNSPWSVDVYDHFRNNLFAYNDIGVAFQPAVRRNVFHENTFLENLEQIAVLGSGRLRGNDFTPQGRGNFWSDYQGYDQDEDGLGDLPYRAESLFEALIDRDRRLRLFLFSPVQQAIETASKAFPAIKPEPKVVDSAPLMTPVLPATPPVEAASAWPMWLLGVGLLAGSLATLRARSLRTVKSAGGPSAAIAARSEATAKSDRKADGVTSRPMVSVKNLTKKYGEFRAVDDLSFEVRRGEAVALWGPNGAGKTTAIRCLLGLVRCQGDIVVAGKDLRKEGKAVRLSLGYVPQELALYDDLSATDSLAFYASLKGVPSVNVAKVLEEVGMVAHSGKRVSELSGGMKQRLALAAALLADPPLLVLDEMTSNLDAEARATFRKLLERQKSNGKTILFTSHRFDEIDTLADRVIILSGGRLVQSCRPEELAGAIGMKTRLKLYLEDGVRNRAIEILNGEGLEAQLNCNGILLHVDSTEKLTPIRALESNGIRVRNIEVETVMPETEEAERQSERRREGEPS